MMTVLTVMSFSYPFTLISHSELRLLPTYSLGLALSGGAERGAGTPSSLLPIISTRVYLCSELVHLCVFIPPFHYVRLARRNSYHVPLGCDH